MKEQILEVLYQCDDNYATLTGVSMVSLMENNKDIKEISINLLDDGISEKNLSKIHEAVGIYGRKLTVIGTAEIRKKLIDLNIEPYKNTYTTYYKILAIRGIKTQADRILYLDGDTIINKSLKELLTIDLDGYVMGAAYDCVLNEYKEMIGLKSDTPYFNCGVMLINRQEWLAQNCDDMILDHFLDVRSKYFIVDQDVINVLFHDKVKLISPTYNYNSGFYIYGVEPSFKIHNLKDDYYFPETVINDILLDGPVLDHCMGGFTGRPWQVDNIHPQNANYDTYLAISPWNNEPKMVKKLSIIFRIQRLLYKFLPTFIYWRLHRHFLHRFYVKNNKLMQDSESRRVGLS